jgi:hypothetical protein
MAWLEGRSTGNHGSYMIFLSFWGASCNLAHQKTGKKGFIQRFDVKSLYISFMPLRPFLAIRRLSKGLPLKASVGLQWYLKGVQPHGFPEWGDVTDAPGTLDLVPKFIAFRKINRIGSLNFRLSATK